MDKIMKRITVTITDEQAKFLDLIMHEDAASNQSEAVQWCIDACLEIEKNYRTRDGAKDLDACYIAWHDIRELGHPEFKKKK